MSATKITYVATTAEGNTVARTSATMVYNFVVLAKGNKNSNAHSGAYDTVEGAWGWSGDKANADKAAIQAAKVYTSVRVVPVEQKLTGKEAKLVLDAIKAAPVAGSGSQYVGANKATMGTVDEIAALLNSPVTVADKIAADRADKAAAKAAEQRQATALLAMPKATQVAKIESGKKAAAVAKATRDQAAAKAAKAAPVAKPEADLSALEDAATLVANLRVQLANAEVARNAAMKLAYDEQGVSYAKIAAVVGVSPMAARAQVLKAISA